MNVNNQSKRKNDDVRLTSFRWTGKEKVVYNLCFYRSLAILPDRMSRVSAFL